MSNDRLNFFTDRQKEYNRNKVEVKAFVHELSHPDEHKEYIERLRISSAFHMRFRGILQFYGADLVAYKQKNPSSKRVNEFLRVLSTFFTDHLEDSCPTSWKECQSSFWEEFIFACFPYYMNATTKQHESENFLFQLKKFTHWLDRRTKDSHFTTVSKYADEALDDLNACERLLNILKLHSYPRMHHKDWNLIEDIKKIDNELKACSHTVNSVFEVKNISEYILTVCDIDSQLIYQLADFPTRKLKPGMLLDGMIGKRKDDFFWTWHYTESIYPQPAKKYIQFID